MKIQIDTHTHTVSSGHAYSTLNENIQQAKKIGLKGIVLSDHGPAIDGASSYLHFLNMKTLPRVQEDIIIYRSCELNILDTKGSVDLKNNIIKNLDFCIASLHLPCISFRDEISVTKSLVNVMKNEKVKIIGHPCDRRLPFDIDEVVQMAKETSTCLEINNVSLNVNMARYDSSGRIEKMIKKCDELNVPIVLASDSHYHLNIGDVENSIKKVQEVGIKEELILNLDVERFNKFVGVTI